MRSALLFPLIALAWPIAASPGAATAPEGIYFEHQNWVVACDNTRTCRAAGYASSDESTLSVLLSREGGPQQPVRGRMSLQPVDDQPTPKGALHLRIQQRDLGLLTAAKDEGMYVLSAAQTTALLSALVRDGGITVVDAGGHTWPLSDKGAAAVLLKIDEFQGRIGTPGALMRKGNAAETSVPAALSKPVVRKAPTLAGAADDPAFAALAASPALRAALRATLDDASCEGLLDTDPDTPISNSPLEVQRLDAKHLLVSVPCWRGAYNSGDGFWVIQPKAPYQPQWVTSDAIDYDAGQIAGGQKGRGLADCGSEQTWTWDGTRFVATSVTSGGLCRGVPGGTWELPTRVSEVR